MYYRLLLSRFLNQNRLRDSHQHSPPRLVAHFSQPLLLVPCKAACSYKKRLLIPISMTPPHHFADDGERFCVGEFGAVVGIV